MEMGEICWERVSIECRKEGGLGSILGKLYIKIEKEGRKAGRRERERSKQKYSNPNFIMKLTRT